ncbi:MAG TPA: hypothetical protein VFM56_12685 [Solimonas sp.]|nr:hypothetical protein [Solimonas sp.]
MTPFIPGKRTDPSWNALTASERQVAQHYLVTPEVNGFAARQRARMDAADRESARYRAEIDAAWPECLP